MFKLSFSFTDDLSHDPDDEKLKQYLVTMLKQARVHDERVHDSYKYLTPLQREEIDNAFRGGVIRGYKIDTVGLYITLKTKIRVSQKFVFRIRIKYIKDHKEWLLAYAKDSYAFIGVFRKAADELDALKDENWKIVQAKNVDIKVKADALREIHNLSKSTVLLMKDLPFITNLSKYYDPKSLEELYEIKRQSLNGNREEYTRGWKEGQYYDTMVKDQLDQKNLDIAHKIIDQYAIKHPVNAEQPIKQDIDEDMMDEIQDQVSKYSMDAVDKDQDGKLTQRFLENQVRKIEKEMEDIERNKEAKEKVKDLEQRHMNVLSYLDEITTKAQKESIEKIKGLEEEDEDKGGF